MITKDQIYRSLSNRHHPCDQPPRILIDGYTPGHDHAWVVDADTGKRPRWILASSLHESATTRSGQPRRTGYVLETAVSL